MIPGLNKRVFNFHDLLMYVALARKHLRLMVLLMCMTVLGALDYYVYARPVYYSRSQIQMDFIMLPGENEAQLYERLKNLFAALDSPPVVERVAQKLGVDEPVREIRRKYILKTKLTAIAGKKLEMEIWPCTAEWAKAYPDLLVKEFVAWRQEKRVKDRDLIVQTYLREMERMDSKMDQTMEERFERRSERNVTKTMIDLQKVHDVPMELVRLNKQIDSLGRLRIKLQDNSLNTVEKLSLIEASEKKNELQIGQEIRMNGQEENAAADDKGASGKTQVVVLPSMVKSDFPWTDLEGKQVQMKGEIADALRTYLPGHHKVIALNKKLESIDRMLETELHTAESRLALEHQEALNKRSELEAKLPELEKMNKEAAKDARDARIFEASRLPLQDAYVAMKKRLEELDYQGDRQRIGLEYLGLTDLHDQPVSPNRFKLLMMALVVGGMLSIGVPFLLEYLDHTLNNLEQVESTFQMRGLGIVPKLADETKPAHVLIDRGDKKSENNLIENFRVIRTNLLSMGALSKAPHVIMVTSAMPKEGKTVVASNLAISFSQTGGRTLLMDTDLRRGRMHRLFGYRKSPGLSDVLLGNATLEEAIRPTIYDNLQILSAGKHLEAGAELLGSPRFKEIMEGLRGRYDRVVIDTPPVLGLSETSVMQSLVDGVLFVIWSGNTPIRNMKAAIEMLQTNGANFYGFVLNRLDLSATTNYYQYYYYSHDYYYHTSHTLENA